MCTPPPCLITYRYGPQPRGRANHRLTLGWLRPLPRGRAQSNSFAAPSSHPIRHNTTPEQKMAHYFNGVAVVVWRCDVGWERRKMVRPPRMIVVFLLLNSTIVTLSQIKIKIEYLIQIMWELQVYNIKIKECVINCLPFLALIETIIHNKCRQAIYHISC